MESSYFTFTALSIKSLQTYAPKEDAGQVAERIARAKAWLLNSQGKTSEDRASQLLGLTWAGSIVPERKDALGSIVADQCPDGGWAQLPNLQSDAYATGQARYALHVAGMPVSDEVYKRGVSFLLRTQDDEGSWFVSKRANPGNNYFDAGFPYPQSQDASFNGTCWATMALLQIDELLHGRRPLRASVSLLSFFAFGRPRQAGPSVSGRTPRRRP